MEKTCRGVTFRLRPDSKVKAILLYSITGPAPMDGTVSAPGTRRTVQGKVLPQTAYVQIEVIGENMGVILQNNQLVLRATRLMDVPVAVLRGGSDVPGQR